MKVPSNPAVSAALFAACAVATTFLAPNAAAQVRPQREPIPNFDKRVRAEPSPTESAQREQGKAQLKADRKSVV